MAEGIPVNMAAYNNAWKTAMTTAFPDIFISVDPSQKRAAMPAGQINLLGSPAFDTDLEGNECLVNATIQIDLYAAHTSEAYSIDAVSHNTLCNMGFRRIYGPEKINSSGTTAVRLISRYEQILNQ